MSASQPEYEGRSTALEYSPWPLFIAVLAGVVLAGAGWALRYVDEVLVLPTWVLLIPVVGAPLVWTLRRPRGPGTGRLMVGLPLAIMTAVALFPLPRPEPPAGTPEEVADLPFADGVLSPGVSSAVVFRENGGSTSLTVQFPPVRSIDGKLASSGAAVVGEALPTTLRAPDVPRSWGDEFFTSRRDSSDEVVPQFEVDLPLTPALDHTTLALSARMQLTYPVGAYGTFRNQTARQGRGFRLFVGTPEEGSFRAALERRRNRDALVAGYGLSALGLLLLGLVSSGYGVRASRRPPEPRPSRPSRPSRPADPPKVLARSGIVFRSPAKVAGRVGLVLAEPLVGSPADRAGLRDGDGLYSIDFRRARGVRRTCRRIEGWQPGECHRLMLVRDGKAVSAELTV